MMISFYRQIISTLLLVLIHTHAIAMVPTKSKPVVTSEQTIIMIRHGEKLATDSGQLNCQGLNRALALPPVLNQKFGKPNMIFAPTPSYRNKNYYYVRPLMTIEPTAISLSMPVQTPVGYGDIQGAVNVLTGPDLSGKMIFVAWEHKALVKIAKAIMEKYHGDPNSVPTWPANDFDSIYILKISDKGISFTRDKENLNGQSKICPNATTTS